MDMNQENGDYVLVHKTKAKITRARKAVMGLMVVGAIAAIGGAGTFASFSATTSNDASFKTGRLVLSNTKQAGTACFSSGVGPGTAENDANLDENETVCDALFNPILKPGTTATAGIQLTNGSTGDYTGNLSLYALTACANEKNDNAENAGSSNLCDAVELSIQSVDSDFSSNPTCVWPTSNCDFVSGADSFSDFMTAHGTFDNRLSVATGLTVTSSRYMLVKVRLLSAGGFTSTGVGLDNKYQNKKANLNLTWHLTEA